MKDDTIFRLYSMTKPIVCTALMTLTKRAAFQLIDPVAKYIPDFGRVKVLDSDGELVNPAARSCVGDLMTHTSGLTYHFLEDSPVSRMYAQGKLLDPHIPLGAAIADLAQYPLAFQPGSRFHYSVGIDVAARVIEVISGRPLGAFLRERLFEPLGMVDTAFGVPPQKRHRLAAMYGRPDLIDPAQTVARPVRPLARRLQRTHRRLRHLPGRRARRFSRAGAMASLGRSATIFASPRCWPTAAISKGCGFSAARPLR